MSSSSQILKLVKDQKARIMHYSDGELWYKTDGGFEFPVPIHDRSEIGTATFMAEEKALLLMRYIRKHLEYLEKARNEQNEIDNNERHGEGT